MKKFALPLVLASSFALLGLRTFLQALATDQPWRIAAAAADFVIAAGMLVALGLAMKKHAAASKAV